MSTVCSWVLLFEIQRLLTWDKHSIDMRDTLASLCAIYTVLYLDVFRMVDTTLRSVRQLVTGNLEGQWHEDPIKFSTQRADMDYRDPDDLTPEESQALRGKSLAEI